MLLLSLSVVFWLLVRPGWHSLSEGLEFCSGNVAHGVHSGIQGTTLPPFFLYAGERSRSRNTTVRARRFQGVFIRVPRATMSPFLQFHTNQDILRSSRIARTPFTHDNGTSSSSVDLKHHFRADIKFSEHIYCGSAGE